MKRASDVPPVVELRDADGQLVMPLEKADISKLLAKTSHVTLDPGFVNTASCNSACTSDACNPATGKYAYHYNYRR